MLTTEVQVEINTVFGVKGVGHYDLPVMLICRQSIDVVNEPDCVETINVKARDKVSAAVSSYVANLATAASEVSPQASQRLVDIHVLRVEVDHIYNVAVESAVVLYIKMLFFQIIDINPRLIVSAVSTSYVVNCTKAAVEGCAYVSAPCHTNVYCRLRHQMSCRSKPQS